MPIYLNIHNQTGSVTTKGYDRPVESGAATGGVWKTTNFLTSDPIGPTWSRPGVGMLRSLDGGSTWPMLRLSRVSLVSGVGGIDSRDPMPVRKAGELFEAAKSSGPAGRLYLATEIGVFSQIDPQGRLIFGSDNGIWQFPAVEIIVAEASMANAGVLTLSNTTITGNRAAGSTASISLNFQKIEFQNVGMGTRN